MNRLGAPPKADGENAEAHTVDPSPGAPVGGLASENVYHVDNAGRAGVAMNAQTRQGGCFARIHAGQMLLPPLSPPDRLLLAQPIPSASHTSIPV